MEDPPTLNINDDQKQDDYNDDACSSCEATEYCVCDWLIDLGHCQDCLYLPDVCKCHTYEWEDYGKFNNCRSGDCKECLRELLSKDGYCMNCFKQECTCNTCKTCESPYDCVCEFLVAHGHCANSKEE